MEEEDEIKEFREIFEKDSEDQETISGAQESARSSNEENNSITNSTGATEIGDKTVNLQGVDSVAAVLDEELFEQVSLKDNEKFAAESRHGIVFSDRSSDSNNVKHPSDRFEDASQLSGTFGEEIDSSAVAEMKHDHAVPCPGPERHVGHTLKHSSSSTSLDSAANRDVAYSPISSPPKPRPKAAMPNVSPELLHLVDSAIMGKPESLDKLKNIVRGEENFGSGDEMDSIAFLVADSLLATMGGVESFEDEDNNPPSVMLNSRAAIVAGELIPWLPWIGDGELVMSPRTRMVRGLLAILRACTRNRAMCSLAGLLGVLLSSAEKIFIQEVGSAEQLRWDGTPLCYCIQYLAGHSLSVLDLHKWLGVIKKTLTTVWATRLMLALEKAMAGKGVKGTSMYIRV